MAKRTTPRSPDTDATPSEAGPAKPAGRTKSRTVRNGKPAAAEAADQQGSIAIAASEPSDEDIRRRAYQMYLDRGADHGSDLEDWVRAEQELRRRQQRAD